MDSLAELEQQYIAVTWQILRAFSAKFPFVTCSFDSEAQHIVGTDHFDSDEAVVHVAVHVMRALFGRETARYRPGAHFILVHRVEGEHVEGPWGNGLFSEWLRVT